MAAVVVVYRRLDQIKTAATVLLHILLGEVLLELVKMSAVLIGTQAVQVAVLETALLEVLVATAAVQLEAQDKVMVRLEQQTQVAQAQDQAILAILTQTAALVDLV
jgi:hypothetical protein